MINSWLSRRNCRKAVTVAVLGLALAAQAEAPPLIPTPQIIRWLGGEVDCSHYQIIAPAGAGLAVTLLKRSFSHAKPDPQGTVISLRLEAVAVTNPEAYTLDAESNGISLTAPDPAGLFYGAQTLRQLLADTTQVPCCRLTDWPAFPLRGFMHDTARNFQTLPSLEAQLDIFAAYKLNVFHWHLTDDPAWRVESKAFPRLNDSQFQTRDPGNIYSYHDIRELIAYARERHITIIPELDMPGHSACFERAMGFGMSSAPGMAALEKIIDEFCREIPAADCPWLHLGSDEIHLQHPQEFMARMLKRVRANGREAFIWNPGLTGDEHTVLQLWQGGDAVTKAVNSGEPFVDSSGGYLNALDPLELVQRYFFWQPCHAPAGDSLALGGILCCWPDVRVADKTTIFRHNAVWPGVLAFSESVWHGVATNRPQFFTTLPPRGTPAWEEFREFENRMAFHRDHYFSNQPFPFVKTAQIAWQLAGPFDRGTNISCDMAFAPEKRIQPTYQDGGNFITWRPATGGTITDLDTRVGVAKNRRQAATVYAYTRIFSATARNLRAWIGFETPGRANRQGGGIPLAGEWSPFGAKVWINNVPVPPPHWRQPGQYQSLKPAWGSEIPFSDEEFYWTREPATLHLNAGWNRVLLRIPCGYAMQKWSFSFIPVEWKPPQARWVEDESVRFLADFH